MKNQNLKQMSVMELSPLDLMQIEGGDTTFTYTDSHGYDWNYTYNDAGTLVGISVVHGYCQ